jgi:hypothetical protein
LQRTFPFKKSSTANDHTKQGKPVKSESFQRFKDREYCFLAFSLNGNCFSEEGMENQEKRKKKFNFEFLVTVSVKNIS